METHGSIGLIDDKIHFQGFKNSTLDQKQAESNAEAEACSLKKNCYSLVKNFI